jgi:peptide deformylase
MTKKNKYAFNDMQGVDVQALAEKGTVLSVTRLGNPVLRKKSTDVDPQSEEALRIMQDMAATVANYGIGNVAGIAAPQVGYNKRILYYTEFDREGQKVKAAYFLFNPTYEKTTNKMITSIEPCMSFPDLVGVVKRYKSVRVKMIRYDGQSFIPVDQEIHDEEARVLQHEIDHLDGILFVDLLEKPTDLYYFDEFKEFALPKLREILKAEAE